MTRKMSLSEPEPNLSLQPQQTPIQSSSLILSARKAAKFHPVSQPANLYFSTFFLKTLEQIN